MMGITPEMMQQFQNRSGNMQSAGTDREEPEIPVQCAG